MFLFVNYSSGGNRAKHFMKLNADQIMFAINDTKTLLHIYSLNDEKSRLRGFRKISRCDGGRIVIAGGDGSVMWVYDHLLKFNIDPMLFPIAIIPFGTGNDLAAFSGWGRKPPRSLIGDYMTALQRHVTLWSIATPIPMDLWMLEVTVKPNGYFMTVKSDGSEKFTGPLTESDGNKVITYRRIFQNYMSIGMDARIGLGFEKKRTKSTFYNKVRYAWEGFKKSCLC